MKFIIPFLVAALPEAAVAQSTVRASPKRVPEWCYLKPPK
jgi:hypothetical protein